MPRTRSRCWEARLNQATPFLVDPTGKKLHLKPNTDDEEVRKLTQVQRVPKVKVVRTQGQFGLETTVEVADGTYLCAFGGMVVPSNSDLGSSTCNAVELQTVNQRRGKKAVDPSRFGNEARFATTHAGKRRRDYTGSHLPRQTVTNVSSLCWLQTGNFQQEPRSDSTTVLLRNKQKHSRRGGCKESGRKRHHSSTAQNAA